MTDILKKALERISKDVEEVLNEKPMPKPRSLDEVKKERLEERELEKIAPSTGYPELDDIIKGFIPGHVYTITGDTNIGKTSVSCNFAVRVAYQQKKVLYIALEPENSVIEYLASVFYDKRFDELTSDDLDFAGLPIDVLGKQDVSTPKQLADVVETFDRYDLIIIDHVGYFVHSQNNWLQEQSNMVKIFAGLAKKNKTAIVLIAHLRKRAKSEKKNYTPTADDISGSGAFKQDSTDVIILTRDKASDDPDEVRYANSGRMFVVKTKAGPNGVVDLYFSDRKANIITTKDYLSKSNIKLEGDTITLP